MMSIIDGPKRSFYSCWDYIGLFGTGLCKFCIWVELPVQRRLCPIVLASVSGLCLCLRDIVLYLTPIGNHDCEVVA